MKNTIRLTEGDLHRIIKESVNRVLNEIGDTKRGQYMLGRTLKRASDRDDFLTKRDVWDRQSDTGGTAFQYGYNDQEEYGKDLENGDIGVRVDMNHKYDSFRTSDMDNLGRKFINFIEKHDGGSLMQTIVDYESGNETGTPCSPLPTIIPEFEDAVLGQKCTPEMKQAIKRAYNEWWHYAQDELMPDED